MFGPGQEITFLPVSLQLDPCPRRESRVGATSSSPLEFLIPKASWEATSSFPVLSQGEGSLPCVLASPAQTVDCPCPARTGVPSHGNVWARASVLCNYGLCAHGKVNCCVFHFTPLQNKTKQTKKYNCPRFWVNSERIARSPQHRIWQRGNHCASGLLDEQIYPSI